MLQQLDPTLQGSDAAHEEGLEQTLLDRLMKMVKGGSQPWTLFHMFLEVISCCVSFVRSLAKEKFN